MIPFINKFTPVFSEDIEEWSELKPRLTNKHKTMWSGGSGFDLQPFLDVETGISPVEVRQAIQPDSLYVMTDYSNEFIKSIKGVYANFDRDNFNLDSYFDNSNNIEIEQMIPLTLFVISELEEIRKQYTEYHSSVTSSVIPDNDWHFCYINATVDNVSMDIIIGFIENLVFWREIIEKYDMRVDIFCALRVGGKSGSWDYTHSPKKGKLFNSIKNSLSQRRPKYWIADECLELREIWKEIKPHERGFYGEQHFFKTDYNNS